MVVQSSSKRERKLKDKVIECIEAATLGAINLRLESGKIRQVVAQAERWSVASANVWKDRIVIGHVDVLITEVGLGVAKTPRDLRVESRSVKDSAVQVVAQHHQFIQELVARILVNNITSHDGLPDFRQAGGRQLVSIDGEACLKSWNRTRPGEHSEVESLPVVFVND